MKNGLIGAGIAGALLVGGYMLLNSADNSSSAQRGTVNVRTDNPLETRAFLSTGGPDKDCTDFSTHAQAQAFFMANGGPSSDPHNLDRDGDGEACETLP
ncbi:MAG: Beta-lactamase domain protein [Candidatus Magasanikbacteria bacterium GW2011_GWA2_42_32]|uniref:Beta-lactamase domain protein n=1 Tax=Candidatus Magasanikbacteria bacterium GW2011_GWA2_42_32 TaxID=1619039 RepID=A0A0G0ZXW1_9BACT|nr:MAG: Beta-lactamase domain protein [Candidatus Magasanikbacteria bacterium GW2011_GWA2_42_32]